MPLADIRSEIGRTSTADWAAVAIPRRRGGQETRAMILELDALETSFDLLAPRGEQLMDIFYARLFAVVAGVMLDGAAESEAAA
jgi:hypothetical protein